MTLDVRRNIAVAQRIGPVEESQQRGCRELDYRPRQNEEARPPSLDRHGGTIAGSPSADNSSTPMNGIDSPLNVP